MQEMLARLLRQREPITEEEAQAMMPQSDPAQETYNFGSSIALAPAGMTSLMADALRRTGVMDEQSVLPEVPPRTPELEEIPGTYEWGMEQVGADPYAPESILGSFIDPTAMAGLAAMRVGKNVRKLADSYFTDDALDSVRYLDKKGNPQPRNKSREMLVYMSPDEFLQMAERIPSPDSYKAERVQNLLESKKPFNSVPFLDFTTDSSSGMAQVVGHEGRHRAMALRERGVEKIPVVLRSQGSSRGPEIRWSHQEPTDFDYVENWPTHLSGETQIGGKSPTMEFPVQRDLTQQEIARQLREGQIGQFETTTPGRIRNETLANEGYTVDLMTGEVPKKGIMMGTYANDSGKTGVLKNARMTTKDVRAWVKKNAKALEKLDNYLGTWINKRDKALYLDVSKRFPADEKGRRAATVFGEKTGQEKGWNLAEFEETPVGNWDEFIRGDEVAGRIDEMARIGREFMDQQKTKEWWDVYGTIFEEVYGPENMEVLMGLIATSSTATPPIENIRVASEYMRRHLLGEPLIQPDWRAPAGLETFTEGRKMPMESTRAPNLKKVEEGRFDELRREKVNDMYRAQAGDPDASVMDRYYTRIAEKPSEGIYTGKKAGEFDAPTKYRHRYKDIQKIMAEAAKKAGVDARRFSADVWVGMREVAKKTGELFGEKIGDQATGPSYGIADIFSDLIESKARFLDISVDEMKARLAAGDENLLSLILATPLGAWLYSRVQTETYNEDVS